jgi:hypothetical protein
MPNIRPWAVAVASIPCVVACGSDPVGSGNAEGAVAEVLAFEAESMAVASGNVATFSDATASAQRAHRFWTAGATRMTFAVSTRQRRSSCAPTPRPATARRE